MPVNNIVVVSDIHAGCKLALCPPGPIPLDDGGDYHPSEMQQTLYEWWREFWDQYIPEATQGEPYVIVSNGDTTDGAHHGATTQISQNPADQRRIARALLAPEIAKKKAVAFYAVRGTEVHVGQSAHNEETLAEELGAIPGDPDRGLEFARGELWIRCGPALCHIMHHIGVAGSLAYETSALMKELTELYADSGRWNRDRPDVLVRSHRHRCCQILVPTDMGNGVCVTTPGWQLKTPFVLKIQGGRTSTPQIGAILIRYHLGEIYVRSFVRNVKRPEEVIVDG